MLVENLAKLIADYEYSQSNIFDKDLDIVYDAKRGLVEIKDVYRFGSVVKQGTCSELMMSAYAEITSQFPDTPVTRVIGNDPNYFFGDYVNHCFLLVGNDDLAEGNNHTSDAAILERASESNPLLVDPCFNHVLPLNESGYSLRKLIGPSCTLHHNTSLVIPTGNGIPLYINDAQQLIYLFVNLKHEDKFNVGIQLPKLPQDVYTIQSCLESNLFEDRPDAGDFFERLLNTKIEEGKVSLRPIQPM